MPLHFVTYQFIDKNVLNKDFNFYQYAFCDSSLSAAASKSDSDITASVSEEQNLGEMLDSSDDEELNLSFQTELKPIKLNNKHKVNEAFNTI